MVRLAHYTGVKAEIYTNGAPCAEYFGPNHVTDRTNSTRYTKEYIRYIESRADAKFGIVVTFDREFPCAKHECAHGIRLVLLCDNVRIATTTVRNETIKAKTLHHPWQKIMESILRRKSGQVVTQRMHFERVRREGSGDEDEEDASAALFLQADLQSVVNQQNHPGSATNLIQEDMPQGEELIQEDASDDNGVGTIRVLFFELDWVAKSVKREKFKCPGRISKSRQAEDTIEGPKSKSESAAAKARGLKHLVGFAAATFTTKQAPQKPVKRKGPPNNKKKRDLSEWKHTDLQQRPFAEVVFHYRSRDMLESSGILDM